MVQELNHLLEFERLAPSAAPGAAANNNNNGPSSAAAARRYDPYDVFDDGPAPAGGRRNGTVTGGMQRMTDEELERRTGRLRNAVTLLEVRQPQHLLGNKSHSVVCSMVNT